MLDRDPVGRGDRLDGRSSLATFVKPALCARGGVGSDDEAFGTNTARGELDEDTGEIPRGPKHRDAADAAPAA